MSVPVVHSRQDLKRSRETSRLCRVLLNDKQTNKQTQVNNRRLNSRLFFEVILSCIFSKRWLCHCKITILSRLPVGGCYGAVQPPSVFNTSSIIKGGGVTSPISSQKINSGLRILSGSIFNDIFIFAHTQRLKKLKDKKLRSHTEDKIASFPQVSAFAKRGCALVCGRTEVAITPEAAHTCLRSWKGLYPAGLAG